MRVEAPITSCDHPRGNSSWATGEGTICDACAVRNLSANFQETGRLTEEMLTLIQEGIWPTNGEGTEVRQAIERVDEAVLDFERQIWLDGGVQQYLERSPHRGHSATHGDLKFSVYTLAGRVTIYFQDLESGEFVTILTYEGKRPRAGLYNINASADRAVELIQETVELSGSGHLKLKSDSRVGLG